MNELQGVVDALAASLGRPVGVDDRRFRALAYSSHVDGVDPVRLASILQREAPREVTGWLESLGIGGAEGYVRVPANPDFGMAARVCVPIRFDGALLGYLWLIDEPEPLSEADLEESLRSTEELGVELFRLRRLEHDDRERERELLLALAGRRDGADPAVAATALVRDGFLATAPAYGVVVLAALHEAGQQAPDAVRVRLAAAAEHARRAVAPRHLLVLVAGERVAGVLACSGEAELERRAQALVTEAAENLHDYGGWSAIAAVGDLRAAPAALPAAYAEAELALGVERAAGGFGPLVRWSALGAYRMLARLGVGRDLAALVPPSLRRLLASPEADVLVPTLACYLDHGGDARAAAAALFVHRSSLYGRLHRIEEIAGVDLHDGEDRLELHLGLRLRRLAGER
ncbi:MAG: helix-turn-helix domain-containing protein [Actinobacteria bacterium]|nr:helix-turn-helix domain-containing protein [Actinomycetota bacterium]